MRFITAGAAPESDVTPVQMVSFSEALCSAHVLSRFQTRILKQSLLIIIIIIMSYI